MKTLQDLTGKESGAVIYEDGSIWVGNWTGIDGIPRKFATGDIGLGDLEDMDEETVEFHDYSLSEEIIEAILDKAEKQGIETSQDHDQFEAIEIPSRDVLIVTSREWN